MRVLRAFESRSVGAARCAMMICILLVAGYLYRAGTPLCLPVNWNTILFTIPSNVTIFCVSGTKGSSELVVITLSEFLKGETLLNEGYAFVAGHCANKTSRGLQAQL